MKIFRGKGKTVTEKAKMADESFDRRGNPSNITYAIKEAAKNVVARTQKTIRGFFSAAPKPVEPVEDETSPSETSDDPKEPSIDEEELSYVFLNLILVIMTSIIPELQ
jgi:hypothetical protein